MDPRERLRLRSGETSCAVCGWPLAADGMRVLAERDDLAFVELPCRSCGATILEMIAIGSDDGRRDATTAPIGVDDVLAMRRLLAAWDGDLRTLVARPGDGRGGTPVEP